MRYGRTLKGALFTATLLLSAAAQAHEARLVGPNKEYKVVVGWRNEPAFAGFPNAIDVFVLRAADNKPVDTSSGDVVDLQVEVQYRAKDQQDAATLESAPLAPPILAATTRNRYNSWLTPTHTGPYGFHVKGKIHDASNSTAGLVTIDETFVCGNGKQATEGFVCVEDPMPFPKGKVQGTVGPKAAPQEKPHSHGGA